MKILNCVLVFAVLSCGTKKIPSISLASALSKNHSKHWFSELVKHVVSEVRPNGAIIWSSGNLTFNDFISCSCVREFSKILLTQQIDTKLINSSIDIDTSGNINVVLLGRLIKEQSKKTLGQVLSKIRDVTKKASLSKTLIIVSGKYFEEIIVEDLLEISWHQNFGDLTVVLRP